MVASMRAIVLVFGLTACVSIPPFHGETSDASPDAAPSPLAVRWISNAYRIGGNDPVQGSTSGMLKESWTIPTTGIVDGDLVLFIANADNGFENFWKLPPGFTVVVNHTFGSDGQSYVVGWKIAAGEPALYAESYQFTGKNGGSTTVSLVAVTGYDPQAPINAFRAWDYPTNTDPVDISSPGLTTTADNSLLVFAAGADWVGENGFETVTEPDGFTKVTSFGDMNDRFDWSTEYIASKVQPAAGPTGAIVASTSAVNISDGTVRIPGAGWDVVVAIAPAR